MSRNELLLARDAEESAPGLERWLVVCLLAFVPGALIVILPHAVLVTVLVPILGAMGALFVAGLIMLYRTESLRRRRSAAIARADRVSSSDREVR